MTATHKRDGKWNGSNDGERWALEIEVDCMSEREPFTVSVWVGPTFIQSDPKASVEGAFLSSVEAREAAAVLLKAADSVDANNKRVAEWYRAHGEVDPCQRPLI